MPIVGLGLERAPEPRPGYVGDNEKTQAIQLQCHYLSPKAPSSSSSHLWALDDCLLFPRYSAEFKEQGKVSLHHPAPSSMTTTSFKTRWTYHWPRNWRLGGLSQRNEDLTFIQKLAHENSQQLYNPKLETTQMPLDVWMLKPHSIHDMVCASSKEEKPPIQQFGTTVRWAKKPVSKSHVTWFIYITFMNYREGNQVLPGAGGSHSGVAQESLGWRNSLSLDRDSSYKGTHVIKLHTTIDTHTHTHLQLVKSEWALVCSNTHFLVLLFYSSDARLSSRASGNRDLGPLWTTCDLPVTQLFKNKVLRPNNIVIFPPDNISPTLSK